MLSADINCGPGETRVESAESEPGDTGQDGIWTAGQVARHLGISESTLRTWHRRYGLDPDGSKPGHYRKYGAADVARLRRMQELISLGMLASVAAQAVQLDEPDLLLPEQDTADLIAAARALDTDRCALALDGVFARRGVAAGWELICCPALLAVDAFQREDPYRIDVEHCLSWALLAALSRIPRLPTATGAARIMLACTEDEQHTLPLAALSAALAEHRIPTRMLGAATPVRSLVRAIAETRPDIVMLWSQRPETAHADVLRLLDTALVRVVLGGPGWPPGRIGGAQRVATLREAITLLAGPTLAG
jgi:MerR family transcriptional regulator, light-induced transcriptional regulator